MDDGQWNRYYDPNAGRFTHEDPIGLAGGMNLYGFAGGDPVNFSDPFGLCYGPAIVICPQIFAAAAAGLAFMATLLATEQARTGWDGRLIPTVGGRHRGEDAEVQDVGNLHGCMTCGTKTPGTPTGEWIRNHVPPTSVKLPGEEQQLGPHCQKCSDTQGGWLSQQLRKLKELMEKKEQPKRVEPESGKKV